MMRNCNLDDSAKDRYEMILCRDLLPALGLNKKSSEHIIEADDGPFKVPTETMVNMVTYEFKN